MAGKPEVSPPSRTEGTILQLDDVIDDALSQNSSAISFVNQMLTFTVHKVNRAVFLLKLSENFGEIS